MRIKFLVALVMLSLVLPTNSAQAAIKAGGTCKKINSTTSSLGKKYICISSGKKLIWAQIIKTERKTTTTTTTTTTTSTESSVFDLTVAQGYSVDIVDLDMVNKGKISDFSLDYIQKVNDAAPQYAEQYCAGLLKQKSEVIVKDGTQTLGVSYFKPNVVFSERIERSSNAGGQYLAWNYVCFLQAELTSIKKVSFYEIYVNGVRIATEPYSTLVDSKFRLLYPISKKIVCITGTTQVMSGLLSCS
jgi:hypothetical protein